MTRCDVKYDAIDDPDAWYIVEELDRLKYTDKFLQFPLIVSAHDILE